MATTKLSTKQLGSNEKVWNESNLVSGKNVKIEKHINPNVITEDTIGVWHFDSTNTDVVHNFTLGVETSYYNPQGYYNTTTYKFGTGSIYLFRSASTYYTGAYFTNWFGPDLRSYGLYSNGTGNCTIDFWYKPPTNTTSSVESKALFVTLLCKYNPGYAAHGIGIIPSADNTTLSFSLANNYSGSSTGTSFISSVPVNATFNHIAFTFAGYDGSTVVTVYVNGVNRGNTTITNASNFQYEQFMLYHNSNEKNDGWLVDELRLSKGIVYTDDFSDDLPTEEYQEAGSTPDYWELNTTGLAKAADVAAKQDILVAGTNISIAADGKTISATDTTYSAFTGTDGTAAGTAGLVPAPATTDAGKYLKADGTWDTVAAGDSLPDQTGQSGKFLTTNGTTASWATVQQSSGVAPTTKSFTGQTGATLATGLTLEDYNTVMVFKNGMLLEEATADPVAANDYSISTNSIVFVDALVASDTVTLVCLGDVASASSGGSITEEQAAHAAMPSDTYLSLTIPANDGDTVQVPTDGYLTFKGKSTNGSTCAVALEDTNTGLSTICWSSHGSTATTVSCVLPVSKDAVISVGFFNVVFDDSTYPGYLRLVYTNGSKPASNN